MKVSVIALGLGLAQSAMAQDAPPQPDTSAQNHDIVVTGFRASLNNAMALKRREAASVDAIMAEDIGKFPDSNLAESMQRLPGVALSRGDAGEGRNISVRGLSAAFTQVRLDGMDGTSQTGFSDIYGSTINQRSFDFIVFPTEIFSSLAVRKTPSADVEEGSLGATVDLSAPKPFDTRKDFVLSATARGVYNDVSKNVGPKLSMLVSKKFGDGKWGVLGSVAYQHRNTREVGYSAVDILSANTNGLFCSPLGVTPIYPANPAQGSDAANCSTGNPRTGSVAAYNTILGLTRPDAATTPGSGAFFPRAPRYMNATQDEKRLGGTVTLQFKPDDKTDISLDWIYSRYEVTRIDSDIGGLSFARTITSNGQPMTSVLAAQFSPLGSLQYGLFNGVDVLADSQIDHYISTFNQGSLHLRHVLSDSLEFSGLLGLNRSIFNDPLRRQTYLVANNVNNFSVDFRNGSGVPTIGLNYDPSQVSAYNYGPALADGSVQSAVTFQNKPMHNSTDGLTADANLEWKLADAVKLRFGGQYRQSHYHSLYQIPWSSDIARVSSLPAGVTLSSITTQITGLNSLWGHGAPSSFLIIDPVKWSQAFNADAIHYCGASCGGGDSRVDENVTSAYGMTKFDFPDVLGIVVRGDLGLRFVHTAMKSSGYVATADSTSPTGLVGQYGAVTRSYNDWLPSMNVVFEARRNLLLRLAASKVMSRPDLSQLTPTSSVIAATRTGTVNNPYLDPIRANTVDLSAEWYFRPGSLLSVAGFYKDIKSYIQSVSSIVPFSNLALPAAILNNSNTTTSDLFTVTRPYNTPGGALKGVEINAQLPFNFLKGPLRNFGLLANYTHVVSKISYVLSSANGVALTTTTADLVGLSKNTASGTLYYEDKRFSLRGTANWRDRYIRSIPASPGSDYIGNSPTLYVDASASYQVNERVKLMLDVQNLTDEQNRMYVDSHRNDTLYQTRVGRTVSFGASFNL